MANHEEKSTFLDMPLQCLRSASAPSVTIRGPNLTRNNLFHLTLSLRDHSLAIPPSLLVPCPRHSLNYSLEKGHQFSVETRQAQPQEGFRVGTWRILQWIFGQNPLDFSVFFAADRDDISLARLGLKAWGNIPCSVIIISC